MFPIKEKKILLNKSICGTTKVINMIHYGPEIRDFPSNQILFYSFKWNSQVSNVCIEGGQEVEELGIIVNNLFENGES